MKLSKLNLSLNHIGDEGLKLIAEGIRLNETLRVITIADAGITKASIPQFARSLSNKRFLTKVLLDSNKIGPEGAKTLAEGLKDNETLTNLHLSHCEILEEGAVSLSAALLNKKNLLVLDLNGNKIMPGGCHAICKSI
jgi:Ran GTPase-activating protein (RanGAP) involved in mRNA processing and transport